MACFIKVEIWTKDDCSWCVRAKEFLRSQRIAFTEYKITSENINSVREEFPDAKTVPIIIVDGEWIGGYEDLVKRAYEGGWMLA